MYLQGTHYLFTLNVITEKIELVSKKVTKNNLRRISKQHAHFQTMIKAPIKFQKHRLKTEGGFAHTSAYTTFGGTKDGMTEEQEQKYGMPNTMSPRFSSKWRRTKILTVLMKWCLMSPFPHLGHWFSLCTCLQQF